MSRNPMIEGIEVQCWVTEGGNISDLEMITENSAFSLTVKEGTATFGFKYPMYSLNEAERAVEEFLRSWEGDLLFQTGPIRRDFLIKASGAPGHGWNSYLHVTAKVEGPGAEANTRRRSPWRRHRYWHIPLVRGLIERYEAYRNSRELLTVMAYFCLSAIHYYFGGQKPAASSLRIDRKVLRKLGELSSTVGTVSTARKLREETEDRDLSNMEIHWVETVVRELIRRTGEHMEGRPVEEIARLADFPEL